VSNCCCKPSYTQLTYLRYAEMEKAEKNKISHRFKALEKLKAWLQEEK
jgi:inosine/xanthosine triphosphate pyrophosphatase family protein